MKKYNVKNYIRYKEDVKQSQPVGKFYDEYTREELIIKFLGLVENISRKFSTSQEASGVMSIMDIIQEGSLQLCKAVDKVDWERGEVRPHSGFTRNLTASGEAHLSAGGRPQTQRVTCVL